jgi:hypothetical protein
MKKLRNLVLMHQGATNNRQRARMSVYWPKIDNDIINATKNWEVCTTQPKTVKCALSIGIQCRLSRLSHVCHPPTLKKKIHADLGKINGRHFLVRVDSFSCLLHIVAFQDKSKTVRQVVEHFRKFFFSNLVCPLAFWSDNELKLTAVAFWSSLDD